MTTFLYILGFICYIAIGIGLFNIYDWCIDSTKTKPWQWMICWPFALILFLILVLISGLLIIGDTITILITGPERFKYLIDTYFK